MGAPTRFVHGDARDVNVMVKTSEHSPPYIRFCDFDWAGREGGAEVYPLLMSSAVPWANNASPGNPLKQEHDEQLLRRGGVGSP